MILHLEGAEVPVDDLDYTVGKIAGQLSAVETRMDRFEGSVESRLQSMDGKLDAITSALLANQGRQVGKNEVIRWGITAVTALGFVGSWLLSKIGGIGH